MMTEHIFYYGDISKENIQMLIAHCDQKIEKFFRELRREIPKVVRTEIKKQKKPRVKREAESRNGK